MRWWCQIVANDQLKCKGRSYIVVGCGFSTGWFLCCKYPFILHKRPITLSRNFVKKSDGDNELIIVPKISKSVGTSEKLGQLALTS